jgi:TolB-like protein
VLCLATVALLAVTGAEPRPVISVLYFDNNSTSPDLDVMRKGLADMMITDLVAWDGVTVVERDKLESVLSELKLQQSKRFDPVTAVKVGKLIGAQFALGGSMTLSGNQLRLDARLTSVKDGTAAATASTQGDKDKIFDLEQELVLRVTSAIDAKLRDPSARKKSKVPDFQSLVAYSKAIDLSDQGKLDEAQAAMQALVSKSPAFLMARERKQQLLDKLKEFERRRKEMTTDSVLQLGKLADEALAQEANFDTLDEKAQRQFLSMRMIKGRFMMRAIKQFLSSRNEHLRIPLKGREAQALGVMRGWVENQRRLVDELGRYTRQHTKFYSGVAAPPSTHPELLGETEQLVRDAHFGDLSFRDPVRALLDFVLEGRADDGNESKFTIAPALGDLDPKEQKAAFDLLDQQVEAATAARAKAPANQQQRYEVEAINLLDDRADALLRLDRDEDAIAALQKILDLFPASSQATHAESKIKRLLGAEHDNGRDKQERWAKALTTCDDMDIRVGSETLDRKLRRMGLAALAAQAAELETACKPNPKNRSAFAYVYKGLALTAGTHEDCEAFRSWFKKYLEADGSVGDMMAYQKNYVPGCELGDVTRSVLWFHSRLDRDWDLECKRDLTSVLSYDKKRLTIGAGECGLDERVSLYLKPEGNGFKCDEAAWTRKGGQLKGSCEVKLTVVAKEKGEFDEGTFSVSFQNEAGEHPKTFELTEGKFRVRRQ